MSGKGPRILLVEDEQLAAASTAAKLRTRGYTVFLSSSGEDALEFVGSRAEGVDLVLMDIDLGKGMDGIEAARRIVELHDLPIVFHSARSEEGTIATTIEFDSYGFVTMSAEIDTLDLSLRMAMRLFESKRVLIRRNEGLEKTVGELRESNARLVQTEDRFFRIFDLNPDAIVVSDPENWTIVDVNRCFCRIYGYAKDEVLGKSCLEGGLSFWDKSGDRARFMQTIEEEGEAIGFEADFRRKDGKLLTCLVSGRILDFGGKRRILSIVQDISERKTEELALARLARLESTVGKISQLMFREGDRTRLLEGVCKIAVEQGGIKMAWVGFLEDGKGELRASASAGLSPDELERIVINPSDPVSGRSPAGRAILSGRTVICSDVSTGDGMGPWREACLERGYGSTAAVPLFSGSRLIGVFCVYAERPGRFEQSEIKLLEQLAMDISFSIEMWRVRQEKDEAETKLRSSNQLYRESFMQSSAIKVLFDPESLAIVDANLAAAAYYGYPRERLLAMRMDELNTVPAETIRANGLLAKGTERNYFVYKHRLASGELRDVEVFAGGIESGGKVLIHSIIHDITEKKRAEAELERLVEEKETLMRELQHRVKNNLNVVSGLISLEEDKVTDPAARAAFENIIARVGSISSVYEKLYESEDLASIDLGSYVDELAGSIFGTYNLDPARIGLWIDSCPLRLDYKRCVPFGLILNELVSNALKYAYPGEARGQVRVELRIDEGRARLTVSDDGPGIPEEFLSPDNGSMGLTLVRMLTKQLEGELDIDCSKGTRVSVSFGK